MSDSDETPRPQAGPLPSKRGEIGYQEGSNVEGESSTAERNTDVVLSMPERHPADRDSPPTSMGETLPNPPSTASPLQGSTSDADASSVHTTISFFKHKRLLSYFGIRLSSLIILFLHLVFLAGTIILWVFSAKRLAQVMNQAGSGSGSSSIFIHIIFAIFLIGQLIFLERRIFRIRAERYMYLHPGEMLPNHDGSVGAYMGLAPWNRPPLPTYAAALAQSGVGTGDVEDNLIAALPPPAYGNTRGSRLLLSGFLRDSLRAQRPPSEMSQRSERPMSYMSQEGDVEEVDRVRRREETLATLENAQART